MSNEFPRASVIEPETQKVTILHILEDGLFKALMARGMAYAAQKGLMSAQKLEIIPEAALTQEYVLNISRIPYEVQVPKLRKMVRHHITQLTSDLYSLKEAEAILERAFDIEKGANFFIESINGLLDKIEKSIGSAHALFMESNNLASYSRSAYFSQSIAYNFPESLLRHLGFGYSDFCGLESFEIMDMEAMTVHIMRHDLREMIFENAQKMISFGSSFEDHELEASFWELVG